MCSCNGGKQQWHLGEWVTVEGPIEICRRGIHLTLNPKVWKGEKVLIAETPQILARKDDKVVCSKARLVLQLSNAELRAYYAAIATAEKAYDAVRATVREAYDAACQAWIEKLLGKRV